MRKKFIEYTVILTIGSILSNIFLFLFRTLTARTLSLSEYGIFSLITGFYSTLLVFAHFDISPTLSKFFSEGANKKTQSDLFSTSLVIVAFTTLFSFIIFLLVLSHYSFNKISWVMAFLLMFFSQVWQIPLK